MNWKFGELTPKTGATSVKAARKTSKQRRIEERLFGNLDLSNHEGDRVGGIANALYVAFATDVRPLRVDDGRMLSPASLHIGP